MALRGAGRAEAGWEHDGACTIAKVNPAYWAAYGAVQALKASGGLTSEADCEDLGDTVGDFQFPIPTGTYKDCICESIDWPAVSQPICTDLHTVCDYGQPLAAASTMMSCQATASEDVALKVCATDSFCCSNLWDDQCVGEAGTEFWKTLDAEVEIIANRMDLSCDQKDELVGKLQVEANTDSAQLWCLGSKTYPSNCGDRQYFEFGFNGKCMGVSNGNLTNGTNIVPWSCNANPANGYTQAKDQAWTYDLNDCYNLSAVTGDTLYCPIRNGQNFNKCLGVKGGSTSEGTNLVIWDCLGIGHPDQFWALYDLGNGSYALGNAASVVSRGDFGIRVNSSTFNLDYRSAFAEYPVTP
ncbi:MAG TPA: RICIN domain-containing protein [Polyangia bacterium]|nr:RICIN domain-containing protein [Polyangia bacterium]